MKRNKVEGFTLIELLAVIVILAIIALIATPIVLNIISDSKQSSGLRSAEMYLDAVEQAIAVEKMNNTSFNPNSCNITHDGNLYCDEKDMVKVEVNGETPINGSITFEEGKITDVELKYSDEKVIVKDEDGNLVYEEEPTLTYTSLGNYQHQTSAGVVEAHDTESGTCSKCGEIVLVAGAYDDEGTMGYTWQELINDGAIRVENGVFKYLNDDNFDGAFTHIIFDKNITSIGDTSIACSINELTLTIPNTIVSIEDGAFEGTTILSINYGGTCDQWNSISFGEDWTDIGGFTVHCIDGDLEIPSF